MMLDKDEYSKNYVLLDICKNFVQRVCNWDSTFKRRFLSATATFERAEQNLPSLRSELCKYFNKKDLRSDDVYLLIAAITHYILANNYSEDGSLSIPVLIRVLHKDGQRTILEKGDDGKMKKVHIVSDICHSDFMRLLTCCLEQDWKSFAKFLFRLAKLQKQKGSSKYELYKLNCAHLIFEIFDFYSDALREQILGEWALQFYNGGKYDWRKGKLKKE